MLVPNIVNITYGRGVGYKFEEEIFDDSITEISATKIRKKLREEGKFLKSMDPSKRRHFLKTITWRIFSNNRHIPNCMAYYRKN